MRERAEAFLRRMGMHSEAVDIEQGAAAFVEEMRRGLAGKDSSLMMLPTYLRVDGELPQNREVIVIDAGGTNFRVAAVAFAAQGMQVSRFSKTRMPGTDAPTTIDAFFDAVAERLLPVADASDTVGFCFSFPAEILPNLEARILHFDKEVAIDGAAGALLGEGVNAALRRRGIAPKRFVVLNDTVATMLGGMASAWACNYDSHIGYILGTGTNTCYMEQCKNIVKAPEAAGMAGRMAINMESGAYALVPQGEADRMLDAASADPGKMKLEKMVSGRYQGTVIHHTARLMAQAGAFSAGFARNLESKPDFGMAEVEQFCAQPEGGNPLAELCACPEDIGMLLAVIDNCVDRAARLAAMNLAAILVHTGCGRNPDCPACITAEGTTFTKSVRFRQQLDGYIRNVVNARMNRYCVFQQVDNVTLAGTAAAGLLNF